MKKSSSRNNLQKVHTYAQDIEAVRGEKQPAVQDTPTKENLAVVAVPEAKTFIQNPTIKEAQNEVSEHEELLIPPKPKTQALRTMANDNKKITETKSITSTPNHSAATHSTLINETKTLTTKDTPTRPAEDRETASYKKAPAQNVGASEKKSIPTPTAKPAEHTTPITTSTISASNTNKPTKLTANKQTRDSSYSATVITDTKYKRFSLWKEFKNKINDLIKSKTTKKKVNYTTPTTPLRKGVVQSATTNTARKTIADYSSLKDRVKARKPEEIQNTATEINSEATSNLSQTNNKEIKRTRFELLSSIEKEVGAGDEKIPEYLSSTNKEPILHTTPTPNTPLVTNDDLPVFNRIVTENIPSSNQKESLAWEHYTQEDNEDRLFSPQSQNGIVHNIPDEHNAVPIVPVPEKVEQVVTSQPRFIIPKNNPLPNAQLTARILPTIPEIQTEIPDIDMSMPIEETPQTYTSQPNILTEGIPTETYNLTESQTPTQSDLEEETAVGEDVAQLQPPEEIAQYEVEPRLEPTYQNQTTVVPETYFTQPKIEPLIPSHISNQTERYQTPVAATGEYLVADFAENLIEPVPDLAHLSRPIALDSSISANSPTATPINQIPPAAKKKSALVSFITQHVQTFVLGGLVIASVVVIGTIAITSLISQFSDSPIVVSEHSYFNSSTVYPVVASPLSALTITEQIIRHNNAVSVSEVVLQSNDGVPVSANIIANLLKLPLDPSFSASLLDVRFGWYREEPFVVIKYTGDTIARGALLQWERTMYTDLLPAFGLTPVSPSMMAVFKDTTVNNIDVRVLYTSSGEDVLMYGIVAPGHVIITTSEMSFLNLSSNFNVE